MNKSRALLVTPLIAGLALSAPATAGTTARVINGNNDGPGSFRQAIIDANNDSSINKIRFKRGLTVDITDLMDAYEGSQNLTIDGRGSTISGVGYADPIELEGWAEALFVSQSGADITLRRLNFVDSYGSGVAILIPEDTGGTVRVSLDKVTIDGATFHGLLVDGQAFDGFNTDDVPHPGCLDPWFYDSRSSIALTVRASQITNNGNLPDDYDTGGPFDPDDPPSSLTGCPADFDGIRVDQGGEGSLTGNVLRTTVDGNLADGLEYDETGPGDVIATTIKSTFSNNGATGTNDLDDGFDIDETGEGGVMASFVKVEVNGNEDEGLDIDEADAGDVDIMVTNSEANDNFDENIKVDEEDDGTLTFTMTNSDAMESIDSDGVRLTEEDAGDFEARIVNSTIVNNESAVRFEQETVADDVGKLRIFNSDLTSDDEALDDRGGVVVKLRNVIQ
jgi:hypothetical protein